MIPTETTNKTLAESRAKFFNFNGNQEFSPRILRRFVRKQHKIIKKKKSTDDEVVRGKNSVSKRFRKPFARHYLRDRSCSPSFFLFFFSSAGANRAIRRSNEFARANWHRSYQRTPYRELHAFCLVEFSRRPFSNFMKRWGTIDDPCSHGSMTSNQCWLKGRLQPRGFV